MLMSGGIFLRLRYKSNEDFTNQLHHRSTSLLSSFTTMSSHTTVGGTTPTRPAVKRARVASNPRGPPTGAVVDDRDPSPALSIETVEDSAMSGMGMALPTLGNPFEVLALKFGSPGDCWVAGEDLERMMAVLKTMVSRTDDGTKGSDPLDAVVARAVMAHEGDEMGLDVLVSRSFKGASVPHRYMFQEQAATLFYRSDVKKNGTLAGSVELVHRSLQSRSFAWVYPLVAYWPPALVCGEEPECSSLWSFELDIKKESELTSLGILGAKLCAHYQGYFFRAVSIVVVSTLFSTLIWGGHSLPKTAPLASASGTCV